MLKYAIIYTCKSGNEVRSANSHKHQTNKNITMKVITLDFSQVDSKDSAELITLALAMGATVVNNDEVTASHAAMSSEIPTLTRFDIPSDSTIASASEGLPKSDYCQKNLTDENFGTELPKGLVAGGFLEMPASFESEDGVKAIEALALKHGKKFRVGTPHEALHFKKKHPKLCPRYFVAFGKVWNGGVLYWNDVYAKFYLYAWDGKWFEYYQVFFVEDLEPSSPES